MNMVVAESPGDAGMAYSTHTLAHKGTHMMGSVHPFFFVSPQGREAGAGPTYAGSHVGSNVCVCYCAWIYASVCLHAYVCVYVCVCVPAIVSVCSY